MHSPRSLLALTCSTALVLVACGGDPQRAAVEDYLASAGELANTVAEVSGKFETLMNVQSNPLNWSDAEQEEIAAIVASFADVEDAVKELTPPSLLAEAHATLVSSVEKMTEATRGIANVASDPGSFTNAMGTTIERQATEASRLMDAYVGAVEETVGATYPDLLQE